jgi:hypothetical protein
MVKAERDYVEIVRIYNTQGKTAAKKFILESYGIKNWGYILRVLKDSKGFRYDESKDKYIPNSSRNDESVFMGMEDLCKKQVVCQNTNKAPAMQIDNRPIPNGNVLFYSLMQDRLTEMSKYIEIMQSNASVSINVTALKAAGYRVHIN